MANSKIRQAYLDKNKVKIAARQREYKKANKERYEVVRKEYIIANPEYNLLHAAKKRAKHKGLPCTICREDIVIPEVCPVLGIRLERALGSRGPQDNSPSLDRLNPNLGYVPGNIAVISYLANRIKSNGTAQQVLAVAAWMKLTNASLN